MERNQELLEPGCALRSWESASDRSKATERTLPLISILLVSDDRVIADEISNILLAEQMTPSAAFNGTEALRKLDNEPPDAVIVNLEPPNTWQVQLCGQIRERVAAPLLVLGGREQGAALARSLDVGADAHVVSPFTTEVLLSQLYALLRRVGLARPGVAWKYDIGTLAIDLFTREVRVKGMPVELTHTEFEILRCLLNNSGRALSYRSLVRQAQGYDCSPQEARKLLKVHIHHLRQKIEPVPERPAHILNVRGFGYLFERRRFKRES